MSLLDDLKRKTAFEGDAVKEVATAKVFSINRDNTVNFLFKGVPFFNQYAANPVLGDVKIAIAKNGTVSII